jgi:tRNA(Arg) A34 adenosine deaminase TadA
MSDNEGEPTMTDHDPEFSRRTMVAGATAWLLYNVAEQRTSTVWAAGQGHAAPPHAGNPKFAEEATRHAIESVEKGWGGPFGAVIVKDGEIIGRGQNRVLITGCPVYHAEVTAIIDASSKLNPKALLGSDYGAGTMLEMIPRPDGSPDRVPARAKMLAGCEIYINAAPCPMCMSAIYWSRINRVYFGASLEDTSAIGFDDAFQYEDFRLPWEQRKNVSVTPNFERETCLKAYQSWTNKQDRHPY